MCAMLELPPPPTRMVAPFRLMWGHGLLHTNAGLWLHMFGEYSLLWIHCIVAVHHLLMQASLGQTWSNLVKRT